MQHAKNREHRLCEGELFFRSHLYTKMPAVERGKSTEGKNVLDNVCFLKLDNFICGNKKMRTLFWGIWKGFSAHLTGPGEAWHHLGLLSVQKLFGVQVCQTCFVPKVKGLCNPIKGVLRMSESCGACGNIMYFPSTYVLLIFLFWEAIHCFNSG